MTLHIELQPDEERKLAALAHARGASPSDYVQAVVSAFLKGVETSGEGDFRGILAPAWEGWRASGIADEEVDTLLTRELLAVRAERHETKGAP